jgi:hypothetical protein
VIDLFGHVAYILIFSGGWLIGRQCRIGWIAYFVGNLGWLALGIALGLQSVIFWSFVGCLLNVYNWHQWRKAPTLSGRKGI